MSPQINTAYIHELIDLVNSSPFPRHMPFQLASIGLDRAVIELESQDCHMQPFGLMHGGVLATLIDTATFWAVFMRLPQDYGLVNVDLKLNYLAPVSSNHLLTADGRCIKAGRTVCYAEASVAQPDGTLLAHGTSTLMALPGKGLTIQTPKFVE